MTPTFMVHVMIMSGLNSNLLLTVHEERWSPVVILVLLIQSFAMREYVQKSVGNLSIVLKREVDPGCDADGVDNRVPIMPVVHGIAFDAVLILS